MFFFLILVQLLLEAFLMIGNYLVLNSGSTLKFYIRKFKWVGGDSKSLISSQKFLVELSVRLCIEYYKALDKNIKKFYLKNYISVENGRAKESQQLIK